MIKSWMIIDGQWGSTGKGAIAGYLARKMKPDAVVCNFGPNAGHTFVFNGGSKVMTRQLPTGIIADTVKTIFIGPGAIIDGDVLDQELNQFKAFVEGKRIIIHERAAVVNEGHRADEAEALKHISSTRKGTGAAMADKTMRSYDAIAKFYKNHPLWDWLQFVVDHDTYVKELYKSEALQIESAQGFELGINSGSHYPYCTGRDITPYQVMADCGIPYGVTDPFVVVTMRTFPIRVGNQYDAGIQVGTSGPVYDDQTEVTFDSIGVKVETTTVTGKPRRVFTFSDYGTERMIRSIRPDAVFLNFVNYISKEPGFSDVPTQAFICRIEDAYYRATGKRMTDGLVWWLGTGPEERHIISSFNVLLGDL
jgi:adenylosuccinate synthase